MNDDLRPGVRWIMESLSDARALRGWLMRAVEMDEKRTGILHVTLIDRYGKAYKYLVIVELEQ